MTAPHRILARRLSSKPDKTAAVPSQTLPGSLGTVAGVNADGTLNVTYNGEIIPCQTIGTFDASVGQPVLVLCLGTQNWAFGPVTPAASPGFWTSYTPTWTATGTTPSLGNGSLVGRYQTIGKLCVVQMMLAFGSTTNGGSEGYSFGLPLPAANIIEQELSVKLYAVIQTAEYLGVAYIAPGTDVCVPWLPDNQNVSYLQPFQNCDVTAAAGTGVPTISGNYTLTDGANVVIFGIYETA